MELDNLSKCIEGANLKVKTKSGLVVKRIYMNNSATTLALKNVVNNLDNNIPLLTYINASGILAKKNTIKYENVRDIILDIVGGNKNKDSVIYVENATEGLNLLAEFIKRESPDKIVVTTEMEHMANYLPFKCRLKTKVAKVNEVGDIDLDDLEGILKCNAGNVSLVTITGASNVTGISPPVHYIAKLAHKYGAKMLVDIVQVIQHKPFNMRPFEKDENIDFVVFSAHKCYTPLNGGALVGPTKFFDKFKPVAYGPGPAKFVSCEKIVYEKVPERFEAGYPDYFGTLAMGRALLTLNDIGLDNIFSYEKKLYQYAKSKMEGLPNVIMYGQKSKRVNIPNISFNVKGVYHKDVAKYLVRNYGIEVGSGVAGADIYVQKLLKVSPKEAFDRFERDNSIGIVRISMGMYNTCHEIDRLIYALDKLK